MQPTNVGKAGRRPPLTGSFAADQQFVRPTGRHPDPRGGNGRMPESHPRPAWPSAPALLLCFLAPPLGLLAWVLGNAAQRATYLRSWWIRTGLTLLVLGSAPLVAIIAAAKV